jgi:hypothetical protein
MLDPLMAANTAQPTMLVWNRPPGMRDTRRDSPS